MTDSAPAAIGRSARRYGQSARLGLIVPTTNTVNEAEWHRAAPPGVSVHTARMRLHLDTTSERGRRALETELASTARTLADADVDVIAYGCTAGSMTLPLDGIPGLIQAAVSTPGVATAPAIVHALRALGARRIAVATPYDDRLNAHEEEFLTACGLEVLRIAGIGFGAGGRHEYRRIHLLQAAEVRALAMRVTGADMDALVLSCTDLPTLDVHEALEAELDRPVVSSNQATLWLALSRAGHAGTPPRWGRLMGCSAEPAA